MTDEFGLKKAFDIVQAEDNLLNQTTSAVLKKMHQQQHQFLPKWKNLAAAAACVLVAFISGFGTHSFLQPVSTISIDINPSIELGVNAFDYVVTAQGFNSEGTDLVDSLSLCFLSSTEAVERIVSSDTVTNLIDQNEEMFITVVGQNQDAVISLCEKLDTCTEQANAQCHTVQPEVVENAHQCGLSYGKYLAYLDALEENQDLTPEDVQDMTMRELKALTHGNGHQHHGSPTRDTVSAEPSDATEPRQDTITSHGSHKKQQHSSHKKHH